MWWLVVFFFNVMYNNVKPMLPFDTAFKSLKGHLL